MTWVYRRTQIKATVGNLTKIVDVHILYIGEAVSHEAALSTKQAYNKNNKKAGAWNKGMGRKYGGFSSTLTVLFSMYLQKEVCTQHEREDQFVLGEERPADIFIQVVLEMVAEVP